jgi:hypothetical protein
MQITFGLMMALPSEDIPFRSDLSEVPSVCKTKVFKTKKGRISPALAKSSIRL